MKKFISFLLGICLLATPPAPAATPPPTEPTIMAIRGRIVRIRVPALWQSGDAFMETVSITPGPGGTQTVKVRSRSLVSVKPKEFMRLRVIVDPHSPVVYLSGLHYAWNTADAQLAARVLGVEAAHLMSLTLNGNALPVQAGDFLLDVSLSEGVNSFSLSATDDQGVSGHATALVLLDTIPPVIAITVPAAGATFTISRVNVSGTVSDANGITSVKVNGVLAMVGSGQFTAYNVPLSPGANTFVAVATDIAGNVGTSERGVNADGSANGGLRIDPVALTATPVSGFAPLTVTFTPQSQIPGALQTVAYDFDGDMLPDRLANDLAPVTHTYPVAGEFFPTVTIATSVASASSPGGNFADPTTRLTIRTENPPVVQSTTSIPTPIDLHAAPDGTLYVLSQSTATVTQIHFGRL